MLPLGPDLVEMASTLCLWGWGGTSCCATGGSDFTEEGCLLPRCPGSAVAAWLVWGSSLPPSRAGAELRPRSPPCSGQSCQGRAADELAAVPADCRQNMLALRCSKTLPLLVTSQCSGRCDCPCAGRSVLAALGHAAKARCFLTAAPLTDQRARAGVVCACNACHRSLHFQQLHLRGLTTALWRLSSAGWEHGRGAGLCLGEAGSYR